MKKSSRFMIALAAAAAFAAANPAHARLGSAPSAGSPVSVSKNAPAARPAQAAPQRAGAGGNIGMSRPDTVAKASAGTVRYGNVGAAPSSPPSSGYGYAPAGSYPAGSAPAAPARGYTGAQVAMAAAGGAVAGAVLDRALTNNNPPPAYPAANYGGGYAPAAPASASGPGYAGYPAQASSPGFGFFGTLLALLAAAGIGYGLYRMFAGRQTPSYAPAGFPSASGPYAFDERESDLALARELVAEAPGAFRNLQSANNAGDLAAFGRLCTPELAHALAEQIQGRAGFADTRVHSVQVAGNQALDFEKGASGYAASIHFIASVSENGQSPEQVSEVWHFTRQSPASPWLLAGIEQA